SGGSQQRSDRKYQWPRTVFGPMVKEADRNDSEGTAQNGHQRDILGPVDGHAGDVKAHQGSQASGRDQPDIDRWCNIIGFDVVGIHYHVTKPSRRSRVAGPMPETDSMSASWLKGPRCSRCATNCSAVAGPAAGSRSNGVGSRVFRL